MESATYPYQRYLDSGVPAWFVEAIMQEYQRSGVFWIDTTYTAYKAAVKALETKSVSGADGWVRNIVTEFLERYYGPLDTSVPTSGVVYKYTLYTPPSKQTVVLWREVSKFASIKISWELLAERQDTQFYLEVADAVYKVVGARKLVDGAKHVELDILGVGEVVQSIDNQDLDFLTWSQS